jgi:hypothetical protein
MPTLFSYVVDHDYGFAPNTYGGFCTLAKCKYGSTKRNIVELAEVGDWIAGTGGMDLRKSAGHGKLIYAMRVDEKITLAEYCQAHDGHRIDAKHDIEENDRFALISNHFFYFGRNAIDISDFPGTNLDHPFEKRGPMHRCDFTEEFVLEFTKWINGTYKVGIHGPPCRPHSEVKLSKYLSQGRLKG